MLKCGKAIVPSLNFFLKNAIPPALAEPEKFSLRSKAKGQYFEFRQVVVKRAQADYPHACRG
jgi:hypothetical protein